MMRADPTLAKIPVTAITANASSEVRDGCVAAGLSDLIGKTFKPDNFLPSGCYRQHSYLVLLITNH